MKSKKIKFLSGVSSLTIALGAALTSIASATEPNPSMPNLSDSTGIASATESHPSTSNLSGSVSVSTITADDIKHASERRIYDLIESGDAVGLPPRDFAHSLNMNRSNGISLRSKFKLFSYYTFIILLRAKHQPLPTDEKINWDTYNQDNLEFSLNIGDIVWENGYYGESEPSEKDGEDEVKSFHYLVGAIILMDEEEKSRVIVCENGIIFEYGDNIEKIFEMLEIACKYLKSSPVK